jgi:hypothetical protein
MLVELFLNGRKTVSTVIEITGTQASLSAESGGRSGESVEAGKALASKTGMED